MATVKNKKLTFQVLALRQSDWRNCGLCVGLYTESGATLLVGVWWRENKNKLVEWKALVNTVGIKSADFQVTSEFSFGIFFNFQDVIIDAIYADIIHGKLDQKNKQVGLWTCVVFTSLWNLPFSTLFSLEDVSIQGTQILIPTRK